MEDDGSIFHKGYRAIRGVGEGENMTKWTADDVVNVFLVAVIVFFIAYIVPIIPKTEVEEGTILQLQIIEYDWGYFGKETGLGACWNPYVETKKNLVSITYYLFGSGCGFSLTLNSTRIYDEIPRLFYDFSDDFPPLPRNKASRARAETFFMTQSSNQKVNQDG